VTLLYDEYSDVRFILMKFLRREIGVLHHRKDWLRWCEVRTSSHHWKAELHGDRTVQIVVELNLGGGEV